MTTAYCNGLSCAEEIARTVALLAGRWAVPVLEALHFAAGPIRFRELQRRVGAISQKELSRQLTLFVHQSLVHRRVDPGQGARVEYELTPGGSSLLAQMDMLGQWSKDTRRDPAARKAVQLPVSAVRPNWASPILDSTGEP